MALAAGAAIFAAKKIAEAPPDPVVAERAVYASMAGPWEHGYAEANGLRFHYAAIGEIGAPLVLLLHGFPECWYEWAGIMPRLAVEGGFRVVAPDMRGYNLSDRPTGIHNYTLDKLASDVPGLIRALGYSRAHVVAHDWGGGVAWQAAVDYPEAIERLVVINAPHPDRYAEVVRSNPKQLLRSYYIFLFQIPLIAEAIVRLSLRYSLRSSTRLPDTFSDEALDVYENAISQPGAATAMLNYYRAAIRRPPTVYTHGRQITRPTLLIWGMQDFALVPELAAGLERWVPNLSVETVHDASHWVPEEHPGLVVDSVLRFLDSD
jgi:pimeloyl-ACP methyl ester carboxylesterase